MNELSIYFDLTPTPHQSVRTTKGFFFQPAEIKKFKTAVAYTASRARPPGFKMWKKEVPLIMYVTYYFKYRKSEKKSNIGKLIPKVTLPDVTDNLQKAFVDAMAGIIYTQDQQIYKLIATKLFWKHDGISTKFKAV